jgi:hypothetical protein
MLETLLGSENAARVLLFLHARDEGYAHQVARFYDTALQPVQRQLEKFEAAGILYSRKVGRTRVYRFNPRCPFVEELRALLGKALSLYADEARNALAMDRRRPRQPGKPV